MRSAHIIASQGRKLPKTFSKVPIHSGESTGSHHKHRHSLVQAAIPPLARFDESETESDTSSDSTSTYDESYNGYAQDGLIRSNDDYRRVLHQRQLMAIRKLIDDSETNFKNKSGGFNEVYSIGERMDNASKPTQNYRKNSTKISGSRKKVYVCDQRNRHPKLGGPYISSASSSSSERVDVDELEPIQVKFPDRYTKKPVQPPISKLEKRTGGRIQSVEAKREIKYSVPGDEDPDKRQNTKESGKLCSRTATQPPQNRTITIDRPASFHFSNPMYQDLRKSESPERLEIVKVPLMNLIPLQTTSSPIVVDERPVEHCLCDSNEQSRTTTPKVKAAPTTFPKPSLRSVEVKDLSSEKPNSSNPKSNLFPPPLIVENKKKDIIHQKALISGKYFT
ncbi:unnamed protein product [Hymenolepis diminuta]|uniref:Uncharacterized protein n=1 Tax=Hymenolepis diminuta TaxID=6216 RepID=A0A158QD21_HYMDI|nr:unnamed protein product [Hymenolepis diminuta]